MIQAMTRRLATGLGLWVWLSAGLLLFAAPVLAESAEEATESPASRVVTLEWVALAAVVICLVHIVSPRLRPFLKRHEAVVPSFAGGMAVAYVFVHVMVELTEGCECVGKCIYLVVLAGFLAFYGAEHFISTKLSGQESRMSFHLSLLFGWAYSLLLIYAMPEEVKSCGVHIVPVLGALALHLLYSDFELGSAHPREYDSWGRYVLATAPIVGWVIDSFTTPIDVLCHLGTAVLAGAIIYNVFRRELPEHKKSSFRLLLVGVFVYLMLDLVAHWL